jgi:hypothetical protein
MPLANNYSTVSTMRILLLFLLLLIGCATPAQRIDRCIRNQLRGVGRVDLNSELYKEIVSTCENLYKQEKAGSISSGPNAK